MSVYKYVSVMYKTVNSSRPKSIYNSKSLFIAVSRGISHRKLPPNERKDGINNEKDLDGKSVGVQKKTQIK